MHFENLKSQTDDMKHANHFQLIKCLQLADNHRRLRQQANQQNPIISWKHGQLNHFRKSKRAKYNQWK
ncbi:hypothetical protein D3C77_647930 [compost metagenome]